MPFKKKRTLQEQSFMLLDLAFPGSKSIKSICNKITLEVTELTYNSLDSLSIVEGKYKDIGITALGGKVIITITF